MTNIIHDPIRRELRGAFCGKRTGLMKTVFRIENAERQGMYVATGALSAAIADTGTVVVDYYRCHPTPESDARLGWDDLENQYDYLFGFASIKQFVDWTINQSIRRRLREMGFRLSVYESESAIHGVTQAVFPPQEARYLGYIELDAVEYQHVTGEASWILLVKQ